MPAPPARAPPESVAAVPGELFTLPVDGTAVLTGSDTSVQLTEVREDSRCPANARCIKMGVAVVAIAVTEGEDAPAQGTLTLEGATFNGHGDAEVGGHIVRLVALDPYPGMVAQVAPGDYVATLIVDPAGE